MRVTKEFRFDAAHNLIHYKGKCERLHGHSYRLLVTIRGPVGPDGIVMDFEDLDRAVRERVISRLDHSYLNDLIPQSSAENIAIWIWEQLRDLPLCEVALYETPTSFVTYGGEGSARA
jgi:6-pyruvoyltetrahydropterin/6-carboxytetrahydropterin synthase